jgi:ATP-dependent helicase/nuclease subunit A
MARNLLIEAAAGTGKTTRLIAEIVDAITTGGARVPAIAVLTFTEKAAGELKLRLRTELESAHAAAAAEAILQLEEARVSTIHTFCADLLRERPVEARVDPAFRVLSEQESDRLLRTSVDLWLQGALADLPEGLRRFLRRKNSDPIESIRRAVLALAQWRHCGAPWTREPFQRRTEIAKLVTSIHAMPISFATRIRTRICSRTPKRRSSSPTKSAAASPSATPTTTISKRS